MYGGSASSGGRFSLSAKTYRAPTHEERARDNNDRFVREAERRKLEEIKHEEKRMRDNMKLEREAARVNDRALDFEYGSRSPYIRGRSRSFGGMGSSPLLASGYGHSPMLGGLSPRIGGIRLGSPMVGGDQYRRREAELANVRARRQALELEAARRQRSASMMARERESFARSNAQLLGGSPYLGGGSITPYLNSQQHHYQHPVLPGAYGGGIRRSRSFGSLPGLGGHQHHSPYLHSSPRFGGGGGYASHVQLSPHLGSRAISPNRFSHFPPPSPRVINNYTINNASPHLDPIDPLSGHHLHRSPQLGGYEMGGGYGGTPMMDPLAYGNEGMGQGGIGTNDFVITDLDYDETGRQVLSELGFVEGTSAGSMSTSEDERLNLAIANLTANAQQRGANAVLSVETGTDAAGMGEVIVRGRAVILG